MNKLSFKTEYVNLAQGDRMGKYLAFYFFIDGIKIKNPDYNPANSYDILDKRAGSQNLIVLAHCTCGVWECSSLVARENYLDNDTVEWTVDNFRYSTNPQKYYFEKKEYEAIIAEVKEKALEEIASKETV